MYALINGSNLEPDQKFEGLEARPGRSGSGGGTEGQAVAQSARMCGTEGLQSGLRMEDSQKVKTWPIVTIQSNCSSACFHVSQAAQVRD